jgi:hypothetical protein
MVIALHTAPLRRRRLLLASAALAWPWPTLAGIVYTPHELMEQYARDVTPRLHVPADEVRLYAGIAELQLCEVERELLDPQYLLVIDRNPHVQASFLFWRLLPGAYELVGASPVSAGANRLDTVLAPQALLVQRGAKDAAAACASPRCARGRSRVYEFGAMSGRPEQYAAAMRVQVQAVPAGAEGRLGAPCPDGCILLPASLVAFLDEYGILDEDAPARTQRHLLPYRGRHLLLVDSERDDRPAWSPAPAGERRLARAP